MRPITQLGIGLVTFALAVLVAVRVGPAIADSSEPVNIGVVPGINLGLGSDPAGALPEGAVGVLPERIRIPRLGVDAPITPVLATPEGVLDVPADPKMLGWWAEGAAPGAGRGTSVLAGHVNSASQGPGALVELRELRPGDEVFIVGVGGGPELRFVVDALRQFPKAELPAADVFNQSVEGRVAIVSCGGQLNERTGHYPDNIIVYAALA